MTGPHRIPVIHLTDPYHPVSVTDEGDTVWWPAASSRHRLFARRTGVDHAAVMTEALHALLADTAWGS